MESARFLDRAQGLIFDYLAKVRDDVTTPDGEQTTALRVAGRADFVMLMRRFMIEEGMATEDEFPGVKQGDVTDIRSMSRLNLIFDTTVRQSYGFGQWKQGMAPEVLQDWPAARLVRDRGVREFRPRHQNNLGEVRLKTDPRWAEFHNAKDIGGFGVPWGPYGYNSGVTQEDVSRQEAEDMGLPVDSMPEPPDLKVTEGLEASTKRMDPDIKRKLLEELRGGPKPRDPEAAARAAALEVRRKMITQGLQEAESRGDVAAVIRYRKAFAALPGRGLKVRDEGEKIVLDGASRMMGFNQPELTGQGGFPIEIPDDLFERMNRNIISEGPNISDFSPLEGIDGVARAIIKKAEDSFRYAAREHVRVFTPQGVEVFRKIGEPNRVQVDTTTIPGNIAIHNHPEGTPPSIEDIIVSMLHDALELRVCSPRFDYAVRFTGAAASDLMREWNYIDRASYAVGQDWLRSQRGEIKDQEVAARRLHAAFIELERRGMLKYARTVNVPI